MKVSNWTIRGISIAGRHTTILVDELRVCFDLGIILDNIERTQTVLISHGHGDHIGSLHTFLSLRHLHKLVPPLCVMPDVCIPPFKILSSAASALDRGKADTIIFNKLIKCNVEAADGLHMLPLSYNPSYLISSIPVVHKIPSFGYCIYNKRTKLKSEYIGLSGNELKSLKHNGLCITNDIYVAEIAFTGDTLFSSVVGNDDFLSARVLIMECTFLDDATIEEAHGGFHIHISEILDNCHFFKNESIILTHFSDRYSTTDVLNRFATFNITSTFKDKIYLFLENGIHKLS